MKDEYLKKLKQLKLAETGMSLEEAKRLQPLIKGEDEQDIEKQAKEIAQDLISTPINVRDENGTWKPF